jgi:uracil-DNA glycosylase
MWRYWGKPVPGFGDPHAALLIVGLAPAAHGANRTGRMFTGDSSGTWLIRAMYRAGFANQPSTTDRNDGLELRDAYLTASVRCAPPDNRPAPAEVGRCVRFLAREMTTLSRVRVIITLGQLAFTVCRRLLRDRGARVAGLSFAHGAVHPLGPGFPTIIASYHPSRQNTNTGRLTEAMLDTVFQQARALVGGRPAPRGR